MKLNLQRVGTYIPEWNGNRELPEEDQIKVDFTYITANEKESFTQNVGDNYATLAKKVWLKNVKKIHNLDVIVDGDVVNATPENLLNLPDTWDFYVEVATHIFNASSLNKEQVKN